MQLRYPPLPPKGNRFTLNDPQPRSRQSLILERIGFTSSTWDQMNWFVLFAKENLDQLTSGDLLNLQEQIAAIWKQLKYTSKYKRERGPDDILPSHEQIVQLQATIVSHLNDIVYKGSSRSGPYSITRFVTHYHDEIEGWEETDPWTIIDEWKSEILMSGPEEDSYRSYLVTHLFDLFAEHAKSLKHCPHCSKIFLQLRRHAVYCSRACQSVATMKKQRTKPVKAKSNQKHGKKSLTHSNKKEER